MVSFSSRKELQDYYAKMFEKNPKIHCEVKGKIAAGNTVVLHEWITGSANGRQWHTIATRQVFAQ